MSALVLDAVVRDLRIVLVDSLYKTRSEKACRAWGDGTALKVRIEPEIDAQSDAQRRYYFAACIRPLSEHTGFTEPEMHLLVKAICLPPDKTSIMQLSSNEMNTFVMNVQRWAADVVGLVLEDPARHGVAA